MDQTPEMTMNLEVEEENQGVGCLEQFQVKRLELQVTVKA